MRNKITALWLLGLVAAHPVYAEKVGEPIVLKMRPGVGESVNVSGLLMNEIVTPFEHPRVITDSAAEIKKDGDTLYVSMNGQEVAQLIIKDADSIYKDSFSLTLTSAPDLPGQHIDVRPAIELTRRKQKDDPVRGAALEHEDMVREYMRGVVMAETTSDIAHLPEGMVKAEKMALTGFQAGPVFARPKYQLNGVDVQVKVFEMRNQGQFRVELSESNFYQEGVKGVAFYPKTILAPGESTVLYIIADL